MKREYDYKKGKFIKNGHTMFEQDVLTDLKRLAYLEEQINQGQSLPIDSVSKRYKILGTSFTTSSKKWFEFDEKGWQEFKTKRWTNYPAWGFNSDTITEF